MQEPSKDPNIINRLLSFFPDWAFMILLEIMDRIDVYKCGKTSILFGGSLWKGLSISNQHTRNRKNPANRLFREFVRITRLWKSDWVVSESMRGILKKTFTINSSCGRDLA